MVMGVPSTGLIGERSSVGLDTISFPTTVRPIASDELASSTISGGPWLESVVGVG